MSFYNALQLDPSILKCKISQSSTSGEKIFYWTAMAVRSALIVAFAVLFISTLSNFFGQENTPLAVALFCFCWESVLSILNTVLEILSQLWLLLSASYCWLLPQCQFCRLLLLPFFTL